MITAANIIINNIFYSKHNIFYSPFNCESDKQAKVMKEVSIKQWDKNGQLQAFRMESEYTLIFYLVFYTWEALAGGGGGAGGPGVPLIYCRT